MVDSEIKDGDLEALDKLLSRSFFILPSMLTTWRAALDAFKTDRFTHIVLATIRWLYMYINSYSTFQTWSLCGYTTAVLGAQFEESVCLCEWLSGAGADC